MRNGAESGGALARVFAGLTIAGAVLLGALAAGGWYLATHVRVSEDAGGETRVETPFGRVRVRERQSLDPGAMGVPVYPGAERVGDSRKLASFELEWNGVRKEMTAAAAEYVTPDGIGKVEAFYRERLHSPRVKGSGRRLLLQASGRGVRTVVALRERDGGTHISLASFTEAAAN